jgi:16S rRNA (uracil1498-N3)-methyltransferase
MHRFYLPPSECRTSPLTLSGREAHHALHVLRLRRGDTVTVLDGAGRRLRCSVQDCGRDTVSLAVVEEQSLPPLPCQITLLQAVPKGKLLESIVQKATELGVARIVPLLTERVVTRLDHEDAAHRTSKWQLAAIEAVKQCGCAWLPRVETPLTPQQFLGRNEKFELPFLASLQPGSKHPRLSFRAFYAAHNRMPSSACVWIGPEGDFTPAEVEAIISAGAFPITLGDLVLRTDTAALYCLSFLNYELQSPAP